MSWFGFIIGYIIDGLIFGLITKYVAESKGYEGGFAWGFWLGIIGLLVVGFRPNMNYQQEANTYTPMYPEAHRMMEEDKKRGQWFCSCGQSNPDTINYCVRCRRTRGEDTYEPKIVCPHCGAKNKSSNTICFACGKPLSAEAVSVIDNGEQTQTNATGNEIDILSQLAKLHEQGILTDEEFQNKKEQVLSRI